jgi:ribonuclease HI
MMGVISNLYIEGTARPNPGQGAAVVYAGMIDGDIISYQEWDCFKSKEKVSNVEMQLIALIEGLNAVLLDREIPSDVTIHCPSPYVRRGLCTWCDQLEKNDWKSNEGDAIKHVSLWRIAWALFKACDAIHFHWGPLEGEVRDLVHESLGRLIK